MAVIATIASSGSYFFLYNLLKGLIITLIKGKKLTKRHIALVTAIAGASSSVFANPFWFMNTRMTLAKKEAEFGKQTISGLICKILNEEGFQAFYAGVLPNMILVLNPIINFVVYETVNDWYRKSHQQRRMST
jgi:adenine nucleotide transporter 17